MIAIIDIGLGNASSVYHAFRRIAVQSFITSDPKIISQASKIVLPGNTSFDGYIRSLREQNLLSLIETRVINEEVPLLGICSGAQILGLGSAEGIESGLGWIPMHSEALPAVDNLKIPNLGWRNVSCQMPGNPFWESIDKDPLFYFSHSYYLVPDTEDDILFSSWYGIKFAAAIKHKNIIAVQFHPEKSHSFGLQFLHVFANQEITCM